MASVRQNNKSSNEEFDKDLEQEEEFVNTTSVQVDEDECTLNHRLKLWEDSKIIFARIEHDIKCNVNGNLAAGIRLRRSIRKVLINLREVKRLSSIVDVKMRNNSNRSGVKEMKYAIFVKDPAPDMSDRGEGKD
jgi:hypothetical protein